MLTKEAIAKYYDICFHVHHPQQKAALSDGYLTPGSLAADRE